jgi:uncharacterized protein
MNCKVVDAVGDMRAHPTGDMGSIGLAGSPEPMIQTAVGGNHAENRYIELVIKGATAKESGARDVALHAALGGNSLALALGEAIIAAETRGGRAVIDAICKTTGGDILGEGKVTKKSVANMNEAFDIGAITVGEGDDALVLHVMNEYMALDDAGGRRVATFPDVIATLSAEGEPISVGQLKEGMTVFIFHVPKRILPLSSSVKDPSVYPSVERAMGIDIARYALAEIR